MAWNTVRMTLLPPGYKPEVAESPRARTASGPVRIMRPVRAEGTPALRVNPVSLAAWLEERGFERKEQHAAHATMVREETEAFLSFAGGELEELLLTFTLDRDSVRHSETWSKFVAELCEAWDFRLADVDGPGGTAPASEFLRLLSATPAWQEFQSACGWPARAASKHAS